MSKMGLDPETIAPTNEWCWRHWHEVDEDESVNSVWCALRIVTRTLELDRFYEKAYAKTTPNKPDVEHINEALREIAPLCCFLGDEEMSLIRGEARTFGKRKS